jgi:hypothetical protein
MFLTGAKLCSVEAAVSITHCLRVGSSCTGVPVGWKACAPAGVEDGSCLLLMPREGDCGAIQGVRDSDLTETGSCAPRDSPELCVSEAANW